MNEEFKIAHMKLCWLLPFSGEKPNKKFFNLPKEKPGALYVQDY